MFQGEHDLFHRHMPFEDHPTRIEQHKAGHEAQDQMPVVTNGVSFLKTINICRSIQTINANLWACSRQTTPPCW